MPNEIDIRQLQTISELEEVQLVEKSVWNMIPIPIHQTFTALNNGGIILGAYKENKMIGFLYSFAGCDGKNSYLCSHMLGILPSYRKNGIGLKMKYKQAKLAKEYGYSIITWTFDPLQSINAYLNLQKLGAVGAFYSENYYGEMEDKLNAGLPSDRIHIQWDLNKKNEHRYLSFDSNRVLLDVKDDTPFITSVFMNSFPEKKGPWFIAIPNEFRKIKQRNTRLALKWRLKTRKVFQALFSANYQAYGVYRDKLNQLNYYLFM